MGGGSRRGALQKKGGEAARTGPRLFGTIYYLQSHAYLLTGRVRDTAGLLVVYGYSAPEASLTIVLYKGILFHIFQHNDIISQAGNHRYTMMPPPPTPLGLNDYQIVCFPRFPSTRHQITRATTTTHHQPLMAQPLKAAQPPGARARPCATAMQFGDLPIHQFASEHRFGHICRFKPTRCAKNDRKLEVSHERIDRSRLHRR